MTNITFFARFCFNLVCLFSIHQTLGGESAWAPQFGLTIDLIVSSQSRSVAHCQCHRSRQLSTENSFTSRLGILLSLKGFSFKVSVLLAATLQPSKGSSRLPHSLWELKILRVTRVTWEIIAFKSGKYQHLCTFVFCILHSSKENSSKYRLVDGVYLLPPWSA